LPVIDLSRFDAGDPWREGVAEQVDWASSRFGAFLIVGHGVESSLMETLAELNGKLFAQDAQAGRQISVGSNSARARSAAGRTRRRSHNVFPDLPGLREAVQDYLTALTGLGHKLMTTFARGLGLQDSYFVDRYTGNPDTLLRAIVHSPRATRRLGGTGPAAGELLMLVRPDESGGLALLSGGRRLEVQPEPGALVCQVGSGLVRLSGGRYLAARHSLRSTSARRQLSLVFSFDPGTTQLIEHAQLEQPQRAASAHVASAHASPLMESA
jgi:polar amino acid transport system ATP-binding protein